MKIRNFVLKCLICTFFIMPINVLGLDEKSINYQQVEEETHSVVYILNGGVNNAENPTEFVSGKKDITLLEPKREGYVFKGWYTDENFKKSITKISTNTSKDLVLYAKWEPIKYKIKFNGNGSTSGKMSTLTASYNKSYTLSSNTFKKTGYKFIGWNTKKDGSGETYSNKEIIKNLTSTNGKTINLYAMWEMCEYTITYELNGGINNELNVSIYNYSKSPVKLYVPTKEGYVFKGWYTSKKYTSKSKVTSIAKYSTGNKKLYAKWEPIKYKIKFNGNGSTSGKMSTLTASYNKSYTLSSNTFKKTGYKFIGWNTKKDGSGKFYDNKEVIKNITSTNVKTINLYAIWEIRNYTITYELNGGINNELNVSIYNYSKSPVKLYTPTKEGYIFKGWYTSKKYTSKSKVTSIAKYSTGNKKLYAKWEPIKYKIKFNGNGSTSGKMSTLTASYNKSYTLSSNAFKKTGYKFIGWNTKADGSGESYSNKEVIKNITSTNGEIIDLYAIWDIQEYTITYQLNGGINSEGNPVSYNVLSDTIYLQEPTKDKSIFMGWYSDSNYKNRVTHIASGSTGNKTLYAKWKKISIYADFTKIELASDKQSPKNSIAVPITYNYSGTIYYQIEDTNIVRCEWSRKWNNSQTTLNIYGKNPGKTKVYITNSTDSTTIELEVTVQGPWHDVIVQIPETIGDKDDPKSRLKVLDYNFESWISDEYTMNLKLQVQSVGKYDSWSEYVYFFNNKGEIIDREWLYVSDIKKGEIYWKNIKVPNETYKIVFYLNSIEGHDENTSQWSYNEYISASEHITDASDVYFDSIDDAIDAGLYSDSFARTRLSVVIVDRHKILVSLYCLKTILKNNPTFYNYDENGNVINTMLDEVDKTIALFDKDDYYYDLLSDESIPVKNYYDELYTYLTLSSSKYSKLLTILSANRNLVDTN